MTGADLTWEQKLHALQALCETSLRMRAPGNWYVNAIGRSMTKLDGFLVGKYGNGKTPQEAIEDDWRQIALAGPEWLVIVDKHDGQRAFQWNGWMWDDATWQLPKPETGRTV